MNSYIDYWLGLSDVKKKCLLDSRNNFIAENFLGEKSHRTGITRPMLKKSIVRLVLNDATSSNRYDIIDEIYSIVISLGYKNDKNSIIEFLRWWNYTGMQGEYPIERYWLLFELSRYYRITVNEPEKALDIAKSAYSEIESFITDFREYSPSLMESDNTLPVFFFARDELLFILLDLHRYYDCKKYLEEMYSKGYFDGEKGKERLDWYKKHLIGANLEDAFREENIEKILEELSRYIKVYPQSSIEYYYKRIGDIYYLRDEFSGALTYYKKALSINPKIYGLKGKFKVIQRKIKI